MPSLLPPVARPVRGAALTSLLVMLAGCAADGSVGVGPAADSGSRAPDSPPVASPASAGVGVLVGALLWLDPASRAAATASGWRASRPADAAQLQKIAGQSQVRWFGNWNTDLAREVDIAVTTMTAAGALPVFVAYNIPQRDCGGLSGNNTTTAEAYRTWIADFAAGLDSRRAAVILEPDALAGMDCLSPADQQLRLELMNHAVRTLGASGSVAVYLDAGNPAWQTAATMADRLTRAGVAGTRGFALNVSNFLRTGDNIAYGRQISARIGQKHFVIDTGRNGLGGNGEWCNPAGRALGDRPTTSTGEPLVDAFLWIKAPGESDGACAGAPASGAWMPDYALGLAQRAAY